MFDPSEFIREFMLQIQRDAAQALAAAPADQDAGVLVTPVLVVGDRQVELDPIGFYRPAEVPGG
ncbi:hypothetical protein [Streptomyces sp. NBC_01233]|uniref:hypothetical protein n=1 Tax=Streptomyces sp. NBC_01233 TaxID=2903787 RepID=UPI002E0EE954|nr:hypothetical protein OG332_23990 [Streptomyces sp. NBC_01233]